MLPETQTATLPEEGVSQGSESKATEPNPQGSDQPQESGTTQVEGGDPQATSSAPERPKPSDFVKQRKKIQALEGQIAQMNQILQSLSKPSSDAKPEAPKINPQEFFADPIAWQLKREQQLREEIEKEILEKRFPEVLDKHEQAKAQKVKKQEAMELLFPKANPTDQLNVEQRILKDPVRAEAITRILLETGLNELSESNPRGAAEAALKLYEYEKLTQPKATRNPNALSKAQMGSTATGTPQGGGKKMPTFDEVRSEVDAMQKRVSERPELRFDDKFNERWEYLKGELAKLHKG